MRRLSTTIQRFRRYTAQLRRTTTAVGLLVLLTLGVLEPLACIIHCELMERAAASHAEHGDSSYMCAFMQHERAAGQAHEGPTLAAAPADSRHTMLGHASIPAESNVPPAGTGQPQPFHEMALVVVALLIIAPVALRRSILPSMAPPQRFVRPPLRPPTQIRSFA